jgi:hypothetical protein
MAYISSCRLRIVEAFDMSDAVDMSGAVDLSDALDLSDPVDLTVRRDKGAFLIP